ncbi:hypothetical protein D3C76_1060310 [compost metagenome]
MQRTRVFDQPTHVVGHQLLGGDQVIHRHGFRQEQPIPLHQIGRGANARHLVRGVEQGVGHLAGDHVGLVAVGYRHQHVGVVGAGLAQHGRERGAALDGTDVQAVAEVAQALAIGIDHGNVVGFAGQVLGQRTADLPCAEDDDLHPLFPSLVIRARRRF